ncbi:hypothetical protein ACFQX6_20855 [Streptosporangium lutulentum]
MLRALLAAVAGGVAAWGAGLVVTKVFSAVSRWECVAVGVGAAAVGAAVFAAVAVVIDGPDARVLLGRLRRVSTSKGTVRMADQGSRVAFVLGTSAGGVGRHVAMLAGGLVRGGTV